MCHIWTDSQLCADKTLINKGSCTFMALMVIEHDWKFAGVTRIIRNVTYMQHF